MKIAQLVDKIGGVSAILFLAFGVALFMVAGILMSVEHMGVALSSKVLTRKGFRS